MGNIFERIFKLIADERAIKGKKSALSGRMLTNLIKAVDNALNFEEKQGDDKPKK